MASAVDNADILSLVRQHLKKFEPPQNSQCYSTILLDHNELVNLDNVNIYSSLTKLSATHNHLQRMYGVARLYSLRVLNLAHNNITVIEGLRDLKYLTVLNLAGNNIKSMEHLNTTPNLEHLDLSDNAITSITSLSHLKNLRKLYLHNNQIKSLQFCEQYLPPALSCFTLADNLISDIVEVSRLAHLVHLEQFSISNNPCTLTFTDYRGYVINWILSLKVIDDSVVQPKECLIAEWLYSQGKGRSFKVGQHADVVQYLTSLQNDGILSSLSNGSVGESEGKLDRILSLARQHQNDVQTMQTAALLSPVPQRRPTVKRNTSYVAPKKQGTPPKELRPTSKSTPKSSNEDEKAIPAVMAQSLDPSSAFLALERSASASQVNNRQQRPLSALEPQAEPNDLEAAKRKATPVLTKKAYGRSVSHYEDVKPPPTPPRAMKTSSASSRLPVQISKKPAAPAVTSPRASETGKMTEVQAALTIQKTWRGYQVRNLNSEVTDVKKKLRMNRAEDHIGLLSKELSDTQDLCKEQKEMAQRFSEELNSLKESSQSVEKLRETCDKLQREVAELQSSMQAVFQWMAASTQQPVAQRPSSLPLALKTGPQTTNSTQQPVEDFAQGMASTLLTSVRNQTI